MKDRSTGLELLQLPEGFQYASFSWTGDPMSNGDAVPPRHDGAVVESRRRGGVLELVGPDPAARVVALPSLGGTLINCAGGPTPGGTWLTCEKTTADLRSAG